LLKNGEIPQKRLGTLFDSQSVENLNTALEHREERNRIGDETTSGECGSHDAGDVYCFAVIGAAQVRWSYDVLCLS
jgi:hypothetical protein